MGKNFKKLLQTTIITLVGLMVLIFIGCATVQDAVTLCYIDPDAAIYADEPLTELVPWTTILDAKRIDVKMDYINEIRKLKYVYLKDNMTSYLMNAEQLKQSIFSPDGMLSLLLIGGPGIALGAYGISKPKDKKTIEALKNGGIKNGNG